MAAQTRHSVTVSGADGAQLLLDHYLPRRRGNSDLPAANVVIWIRTPYGRTGMASIANRFAKEGAHVVVESMRGTDGSDGSYDPFDVTPDDAAVVLAWMRSQSWFPATVVTWGISAIGYASWGLTELDVPEWRLAILQDAPSELRDGLVYPGGAFAGKTMLGFLGGVEWQVRHPGASLPRVMLASIRAARRANRVLNELPLGAADERLVEHRVGYFQEWLAHENADDYWKPLDRRRGAPAMPALVHLATGWYDLALASTLADYRTLRDVGKTVRLLVGPWYHGRGAVDKAYRGDVDLWLRAAGSGEPPASAATAPVRVYVGGADVWRDLPDWPPPGYEPTEWHLHSGGVLRQSPAPPSTPDRYTYDPAHPTPSVGGAVENYDGTAGRKDNRKLEQRPDVLTYDSEPMPSDVEVIGSVVATIAFRSDLEYTDLVVRLCDVHPDGRSLNVCDGARRLRPGHPAGTGDGSRLVEADLVGLAHVFRAGHRIRLQVSSGAHPRLVRNTGTGESLATATQLRAARQEILHDPEHRSVLILPVRAG